MIISRRKYDIFLGGGILQGLIFFTEISRENILTLQHAVEDDYWENKMVMIEMMIDVMKEIIRLYFYMIFFMSYFILTYECYTMISAPMNDDRSCI